MSRATSVVIVGEVDHGKSSLMGRLLAETESIAESRIETVRQICKDQGKDFEYAFLLDAFEEEQRQGITIDVSQTVFRSHQPGRENGTATERIFRFIDAPGHREFLKSMVSGSSGADAAILLIDAERGIQEQSLRHCYLLKLIGVKSVIVAINKMDLLGYSEAAFSKLRDEHTKYLRQLDFKAEAYIPLSAKMGVNVSARRPAYETAAAPLAMPWYTGPTLLESLHQLPEPTLNSNGPVCFAVQDIYKFDERRIVVGRLETGRITAGDTLQALPSNKSLQIAKIEVWNSPTKETAQAGESIGLTLTDSQFLERGAILVNTNQPMNPTTFFDANLFWLGKTSATSDRPLKIKLLTQECECRLAHIHNIVDTGTLALTSTHPNCISSNEVAVVSIKTSQPILVAPHTDQPSLGRFVIVDGNQVVGGGIVTREHSAHAQMARPLSRDISWQFSQVTVAERTKANKHRGAVVWFTGLSGAGKTTIAHRLERSLFQRGCQTVVLDGDNLRHSLNADLGFSPESRGENIRRAGEVAKLFAEAGQIAITAFISPFASDRLKVRKIMNAGSYFEIFIKCPIEVCELRDPKGHYKRARRGELTDFTGITSPFEEPLNPDLVVNSAALSADESVLKIIEFLRARGILGSLEFVPSIGLDLI